MKKLIFLLIAIFIMGVVGYSQIPVKRNKTGMINGHEWVDLGLPSGMKWATCNIGAASPSEYGNYYACGEISTKALYVDSNSLTYGKNILDLRLAGIIGTSGILSTSHDAARVSWGGSWRMPTKEEYQELIDNCKWTWTNHGGHNGYKVSGPNGHFIFLPAGGWYRGNSLYGAGENGYYWSSTPNEGNADYSYSLGFCSSDRGMDWYRRYGGQLVRPVSE